jgi:transcription elongation factor Elf1
MGRRRKKTVKIPKKALPRIFLCPRCGAKAVSILLDRNKEIAKVDCGECGLKDEIKFFHAMAIVDIYCKFIDNFHTSTKLSTNR